MELIAISRNTFLKYESPCCLEENAMLGGEFHWKNWDCPETLPAVELVSVIPCIFVFVFKKNCLVMAFLIGRGERKYLEFI